MHMVPRRRIQGKTNRTARTNPVIVRLLSKGDAFDVEDTGAPLATQHVSGVVADPAVTVVLHFLILIVER